MCGRFWMGEEGPPLWMEAVSGLNRKDPGLKTHGEIFPSDRVPVLALNRAKKVSVFGMRWGYNLGEKLVINARSETAGEKPMFADGMHARRCAIPAARYFEWNRNDPAKPKYAVQPKTGMPFFLAGIYRIEQGRPAFVVLTRAPDESVAFLHDRMPVILPWGMEQEWVSPEGNAGELLGRACREMSAERVPGSAPRQTTLWEM